MKYVYVVKLAMPVKMQPAGHHYSGKETSWLHVVASSYANAVTAVEAKYGPVCIVGINCLNYNDVPIVVGE